MLSSNSICWPDLFAVLSLDLFEPFQPEIGIHLDRRSAKAFFREIIRQYLPEYRNPPEEITISKVRCRFSEDALARVLQSANEWIGPDAVPLFEHLAWVWADIQLVWDWFAYETIFGYAWGARKAGIDSLEIGALLESIWASYRTRYVEPVHAIRTHLEQTARQPLSAWDTAVFAIDKLTFEDFPANEEILFKASVMELVRREYFNRWRDELLSLIDDDTEFRIRSAGQYIIAKLHISYPGGRWLPCISQLQPRLPR